MTPLARQRIEELYGPVGREGRRFLERYSDGELRFLSAFLRDGHALQAKHAALIRETEPSLGAPSSAESDGQPDE
jgi:hypothetical protein